MNNEKMNEERGRRNCGCLPRRDSLAGSLLLLLVARLLGRLGQDAPLGDEDDVTSAEFLLQLPDQTRLDLLVGLELGNGDKEVKG